MLMENTQKILGLLYLGKGLVKFKDTFEHTYENIARVILKRLMKEEGIEKFNSKTRVQWMQSNIDYYNENFFNDTDQNTIEDNIDSMVSHVLRSNAPHIIGLDRVQVSNEFVDECEKALLELLEKDLEASK